MELKEDNIYNNLCNSLLHAKINIYNIKYIINFKVSVNAVINIYMKRLIKDSYLIGEDKINRTSYYL